MIWDVNHDDPIENDDDEGDEDIVVGGRELAPNRNCPISGKEVRRTNCTFQESVIWLTWLFCLVFGLTQHFLELLVKEFVQPENL